MAPTAGKAESAPSTSTTPPAADEQQQQEQQDQQQVTPEPGGQASQPVVIDKDTKLPDDHPLVTTLASQKSRIAELTTQLAEANARAGKASQLEEDLGKRPTTEAMTALQTKYERLEAFAQATGLGKALDSRTFTRRLFETDDKIADIVKDFNKENPSATQQALGGGAAAPAGDKADMNTLLRKAAGH